MKNFIKLIITMFIFSNISNLFAITVFDQPVEEKSTSSQNTLTSKNTEKPSVQKIHKKKCPCPAKKKNANKDQVIHTNNKPVHQKSTKNIHKTSSIKQVAKVTPKKTSKAKSEKIAPTLKEETPSTLKETPKVKEIISTKEEHLQNVPATQAITKVNLPSPLIIVNNFEEDPIFISAIRGVLYSINKNLNIIDISSANEPKNTIPQAYKLLKASSFWGKDTVFISGSYKNQTETSIIIAKSKNNQFFVTQNSGVLTFIEDTIGISEVREVQRVNFESKTINGRDVEYLIGAKLIDNPNIFNTLGEPISLDELAKISYTPLRISKDIISSLFITEDKNSGDIFTFIPTETFAKFNPQENDVFKITLSSGINLILDFEAIYKNSLSYIGGNKATIFEYKNSIGSYIALKNIQGNLPADIDNYKISITPLQKGDPIDTPQNDNVHSTSTLDEEATQETHKIYPYVDNTVKKDTPQNDNTYSTNTLDEEATKETHKIYPYVNNTVKRGAYSDTKKDSQDTNLVN